ncbi:unnamed protein product, partial [marine sediment metagenome]
MSVKPSLVVCPPEDVPGAAVVNLLANVPYSVESIARFSKIPGEYVVSLLSFSLAGTTGISFYVNTDGTFRIIDSQSYACYSLDRDEDVYVSAKTTLALSLLSDAIANNIPIRYLIRVSKPSVIEKILLGIKLTDKDTPLNNKFALDDMLRSGYVPKRTPLLVARKQIARTISALAGVNPQIGETITVPKNRYVVLDEIAVDGYEVGVTDNFIVVDRDLNDEYVKLNAFAMPPFMYNTVPGTWTPDIPLSYSMKFGIPALDKISVSLENGGAVVNLFTLTNTTIINDNIDRTSTIINNITRPTWSP